jgi:Domain of unknown function (DUF4397)
MSRWLTTALLTSVRTALFATALSVLCILSTSCGSSRAQVRIINAIPDTQPLDIYINGAKVATNLAFRGVQPDTSPVSYMGVAAGTATIEGFPTGTTTNPVSPNGTISLNALTQYTMVAIGLTLNDSPPLILVDNNTIPTSGNVEFRIINASPSAPPNGLDIYIVPPGTDITNFTPQISALQSGQGSIYESLIFAPTGYSVIFTANASKIALINQTYPAPSASITTLVILDNPGGMNGMSQTPLVLNDVN